VKVLLTERFEGAYVKLTAADRKLVRKALILIGGNPGHPGLRVKKMEGRKNIWEARPSRKLRMTFEIAGDAVVMRNVGDHDRVLKKP